jgi:hypothetical protein
MSKALGKDAAGRLIVSGAAVSDQAYVAWHQLSYQHR